MNNAAHHGKQTGELVDFWKSPALIQPNNFVYKSLSNWAFNIAVGCSHACRFCYVPSASTIKQGPALAAYGVRDPDEQWGEYVLLRPWAEAEFLKSLRAAENTPAAKLNPDGNRAVIYCSTTDPYQNYVHADVERHKELLQSARRLVRRSLELIRDNSKLNVRILTRSPLARSDFDLFQTFGNRLMFGMSVPTLNSKLSRIYEPKAPSPIHRLETLLAAKRAGLHIFVAVAPTYPECDEDDLRATFKAIADLDPFTVFHEPINIRAENVARIAAQAQELGLVLNTEVFATPESWRRYALGSLKTAEKIAKDCGLLHCLHLWPDKSLGSRRAMASAPDPDAYCVWLNQWWQRISEWPGKQSAAIHSALI
jgi:DNA repair photolyase